LTDRSAAEGGWKDRVDPRDLLTRGVSPILCLTHPNNWASGASLWGDRVLTRLLNGPGGKNDPTLRGPVSTGSDEPPL